MGHLKGPSRFNSIGLNGNRGTDSNILDSFIQTLEVAIAAVPGSTVFSTGIFMPELVSPITGYILSTVGEVTGTIKTLTVGYIGDPTAFIASVSSASTGPVGIPKTATSSPQGQELIITLGSDDWVEFEGILVFGYHGVPLTS